MLETTIVVNTCDAYEDVWKLFFSAFKEYWPNCQYKIIINTESKREFDTDLNIQFQNFKSPNDVDMWGLRLKQALLACETKYVVMLYDDFILEGYVNDKKIDQCIQWLNNDQSIAVFYFSNIPVNSNINDNKFIEFELMPQRGDYKLNSAPSIWRRDKLINYIDDNDNPWAWEFFGTYRTYKTLDLFYCAIKGHEDVYPYNYSMGGAIYRGKWVRQIVLPLFQKYQINIDTSKRGFADDKSQNNQRSFLWKIKFIMLGFRMIKFGVFIYLYRILKRKLFA